MEGEVTSIQQVTYYNQFKLHATKMMRIYLNRLSLHTITF